LRRNLEISVAGEEAPVSILHYKKAWALHGEIEITSVRPTSKGNRGIVVSRIDVKNQKDEVVMTYEATRMLAGRSADQGTPQTA